MAVADLYNDYDLRYMDTTVTFTYRYSRPLRCMLPVDAGEQGSSNVAIVTDLYMHEQPTTRKRKCPSR